MIDFSKKYDQDEILEFLKHDFLKDFQKDIRSVDIPEKKFIRNAYSLGHSPDLELVVFEFEHSGSTEKRVTLTKEAFSVLRDSGNFRAIAVFHSLDTDDWRFSYMTAIPVVNERGKVKTILSNPKRFSFFLGPKAKVATPTKFLIKKGTVESLEDLKDRFSIEVVNKEFYAEISKLFIELVGGTLGSGKKKEKYKALLKLPDVKDSSQTAQEFAVRLIGRLIFCWFLREKRNGSEESLMPKSLLSYDASKTSDNYYHSTLEPIFFKVLNVPKDSRKEDTFRENPFDQIPYLNGGLFTPHDDDFYSIDEAKREKNKKEVTVPDKWIQSLFEVLETYNFTIDENSAFDEELSIDPEMLGRIFENLLAEINPEAGESARKSTGSYYTPRVIVDYMVDESLYLYLQNKTGIEEEKLRSLISYDLDDDLNAPLTDSEKVEIIDTLDELKILDPACGSGAFPMGALQKIVFILQQLDPQGQHWFKAQIKSIPVELRKNLEHEHEEKNFDYIRKLGVIRKNIFGVDIQPIATEISRLRCFLTLVVDQKVDDEKENRGIDPLPNLDFKFVTANSLINLPDKDAEGGAIRMFQDEKGIERLKEVRDQFFNASNFERIELKDTFRKIQLEMSKHYNSVKDGGADLTEKLLSWDPFSHKTTDWFDPEWMFGIREGFDIVMGNPPWGSDLTKKEKSTLKHLYKEIDSSTPNSFAYFLGLGNRLSSEVLTYVLPDSILIKDFMKTRKTILSGLDQIIWYQNTGLPEKLKPFVYVEHDVCVLFSTREHKENLRINLNIYEGNGKITVRKKTQQKSKIIRKEFDYIYNLTLSGKDLHILEKLNRFDTLDQHLQCHEGIHTGNIRPKLFVKKEGSNSKPLFYGAGKGSDTINNYYSFRKGWYVNYDASIINKEKGEYASLRDENIFKFPKIYVTRTGNPFRAFYDEDNYASNNFFSIQFRDLSLNEEHNLKFVLAIANSEITRYFIRKFAAPRLGNTFVETKIIHLLKTPLPVANASSKQEIISLVDSIIDNLCDRKQIDPELLSKLKMKVSSLYGLSDNDIDHIHEFFTNQSLTLQTSQ